MSANLSSVLLLSIAVTSTALSSEDSVSSSYASSISSTDVSFCYPEDMNRPAGENDWQTYLVTDSTDSLWDAFKQGHPQAMERAIKREIFASKLAEANFELTRLATSGNAEAQLLLIEGYMNNAHGLKVTQGIQRLILSMLTGFAETNPMIRQLLVEAYMDGYFGISPKKARSARRGKAIALKYMDSPQIGDLIITAMKDEKLKFKSRRAYMKRIKTKQGRWISVPCKSPDLTIIETLAFTHNNKTAQTFLLECWIDSKYGADSLDKNNFRKIAKRLEPYIKGNDNLKALFSLIWDQNYLGYKQLKDLNQKRLEFKQKYPDVTASLMDSDDELIEEATMAYLKGNPFAQLYISSSED